MGDVDIAELHAPFTHQEKIVAEALSLKDDTVINPSGGPLAANPMMAAGLIRIGEVANRIMDGSVNRGVAHATSGHLLQQNLVAVLEANGLTPADVVKTNVFLVRMDDFAAMNEEYAKVFSTDFPARSAVAVHQLPTGAVFEIEAWAHRGNAS